MVVAVCVCVRVGGGVGGGGGSMFKYDCMDRCLPNVSSTHPTSYVYTYTSAACTKTCCQVYILFSLYSLLFMENNI